MTLNGNNVLIILVMVKYNKKDRGNCVGESTANDFPLQETTTRPHTQLRVLLLV